jgi:lipopolysaccharide export system permease protein
MLINKLIIKAVWQAFLMVMLAVMGIFFMVLLIGELGSIGHFNYTVTDALLYSAMLLPSQLYALLPMLGFLAAILGLGRLSTQNELVSIRAAGFSRWQMMKAVIFAAVVLIGVITWLGENYAFKWAYQAHVMKGLALKQTQTFQKKSHVWVKGDHQLIFIDSVNTPKQASGITVFGFDQNQQLTSVITAPTMVEQQAKWLLQKPSKVNIGAKQITKKSHAEMALNIDFKPSYVQSEKADPNDTTIKQLWAITHYRWQHHLAADQMSFAFWLRLFQPLNTIIMIWLGIPFVFGTLRHSTMGFRLLIGIVVGFSFYMFNQVIGPLCMLYQWPPVLAAVMPSLLLLIFGIYLLSSRRL